MISELYFAYSQFYIYDRYSRFFAPMWTDEHLRQGFARLPSGVAVHTLRQDGRATVTVNFDPPASLDSFERAIAVPQEIRTGAIVIEGPEEASPTRVCPVSNGHYRLIIAQRILEEDEETFWCWEDVHLYFEKLVKPTERSEILIADEQLQHAPYPLIETAEEAVS